MKENLPLILQSVTVMCLILILFVVSIPYLSILFSIYQMKVSKTPELDNAIRQINDAIEFDYAYVELNASRMPNLDFRTLLKTLRHNGIMNKDVKTAKNGTEILTISLHDYQGPEFIEVVHLTEEEAKAPPYKNPAKTEFPKANKVKPSYDADGAKSLFETKLSNVFDFKPMKELVQKDQAQPKEENANNVIEIDFTKRQRKT